MRGWIVVATAFIVSLAAAPVSAQCQEIEWEGGALRNCPQPGGGSGGGQDEGGFWTGPVMQTIYSIAGLGAAAGAGIFGWNRVRRRRNALRTFLADVESSYAAAKAEPNTGLAKLEALRSGLHRSHESGHLEDTHFLNLDRKLADYIGRIRMLQLERAFPELPMSLFTEIRSLLGDGVMSAADLATVEKRATELSVASGPRQRLIAHLRRWTGEPATVPTPVPARRRLAVVAR